jgi:hypothetical protein
MTNKQIKELLNILQKAGVHAYKRGQLEIVFKEPPGAPQQPGIRAISEPVYDEEYEED